MCCSRWRHCRPSGQRRLAACPVLDLTLGLVLSNAVTLLDAANELGLLAVDDRKIIVGQFAPLLLHLAGDLLPVTFDPIPVHVSLISVWISAPLRSTPATMPPLRRLLTLKRKQLEPLAEPATKGVSALVGFLGDQPSALFREARAVSALQLQPALIDGE
jgi:hypothetical protein